jgi:hypothetical protein
MAADRNSKSLRWSSRRSDLGVPEFGSVEIVGAGTFDDASETILALRSGFVAPDAERKDFRIVRNRRGGAALRARTTSSALLAIRYCSIGAMLG